MAGLSSIVGARGHEKRGCRWRARINQTGVKINCKTLASRVPFPPPSSPSILSLSISAALPSLLPLLLPPPLLALSWLSCVTREPSHLPLCVPPPSPPTPARSLVRSAFVLCSCALVCFVCAKGVRECERAAYVHARHRTLERNGEASWIEREVSLRGEG